jgi:hypothetical protein
MFSLEKRTNALVALSLLFTVSCSQYRYISKFDPMYERLENINADSLAHVDILGNFIEYGYDNGKLVFIDFCMNGKKDRFVYLRETDSSESTYQKINENWRLNNNLKAKKQ